MLSSQRDPQSLYLESLAKWSELDYHQRPRPLRGRRKWATGICVIAAVAFAAWSVWPSNHHLHQAAPVSTAHAFFNHACEMCHTATFGPAGRLVHGDSVRSVPDRACLMCHDGAEHQHGVTMANCASC